MSTCNVFYTMLFSTRFGKHVKNKRMNVRLWEHELIKGAKQKMLPSKINRSTIKQFVCRVIIFVIALLFVQNFFNKSIEVAV